MSLMIIPGKLTDIDVFNLIAKDTGIYVEDKSFPMVHFFRSSRIYSCSRFFQVFSNRIVSYSAFAFSVKFYLPQCPSVTYVFNFNKKANRLYLLHYRKYVV